MSRRAGSDDASTETDAVVATANVRMTTSPYRREVVIETSPWKTVCSNRDLIPSNRTSRSETRTCFSISPLKGFLHCGLIQAHKGILSGMTTSPVYENSTTFLSIDESNALPLAHTPRYG